MQRLNEPLTVYIGYDTREADAFKVAMYSLLETATCPVRVVPLKQSRLRMSGLLHRPVDHRNGIFDLNSSAPQATEFANARFFVPLLAHSGIALFVDCDVVFLGDVAELFDLFDPDKAVQVVQSTHLPKETVKMVGAPQTKYPRKNWSSVMLWNVDHPANKRLTLDVVNNWPGRNLHAFDWLSDSEIGSLPKEWNWLVNVQDEPENPKIAHYTLGGPWLPTWKPAKNDGLWLQVLKRAQGHKEFWESEL